MRRRHFLGVVGAAAAGGCLRLVDTQEGSDASGDGSTAGGAETRTAADGQGSGGQDPEGSGSGTESGGGGGTTTDGWPTVAANPARTGHAPDETGPTAAVTPEWEVAADASDASLTTPTVADGTVYAGGYGDGVRAIDAETGQQRWAAAAPGVSSVTVAGGTVYVGGNRGVRAYGTAAGERQWTFEFETEANRGRVDPAVVDGTVFVGAGEAVYALDAATGDQRWRFGLISGASTPAVVDGTVFVGGSEALYALDAAAGDERWRTQYRNASTPAVAGDTVYVGVRGGVRAVNAADGSEAWRLETQTEVPFLPPSVAGGAVYVGTFRLEAAQSLPTLRALDAATGDERWRIETQMEVQEQPAFIGFLPAVVDGIVYVGRGVLTDDTKSGYVAVDAADGTRRWTFPIEGTPRPVAVADGSVFAAGGGTLRRLTE